MRYAKSARLSPRFRREKFLFFPIGSELWAFFSRKIEYYHSTRLIRASRDTFKIHHPLSFSLSCPFAVLFILFSVPSAYSFSFFLFFFYYRPTLDVEMIFRGFAFPWRWYRAVRGINTDRLQLRPVIGEREKSPPRHLVTLFVASRESAGRMIIGGFAKLYTMMKRRVSPSRCLIEFPTGKINRKLIGTRNEDSDWEKNYWMSGKGKSLYFGIIKIKSRLYVQSTVIAKTRDLLSRSN